MYSCPEQEAEAGAEAGYRREFDLDMSSGDAHIATAAASTRGGGAAAVISPSPQKPFPMFGGSKGRSPGRQRQYSASSSSSSSSSSHGSESSSAQAVGAVLAIGSPRGAGTTIGGSARSSSTWGGGGLSYATSWERGEVQVQVVEAAADDMTSPDPTSKFHHTRSMSQSHSHAHAHAHTQPKVQEVDLYAGQAPEIDEIECFASPDPMSKYHKTFKAATAGGAAIAPAGAVVLDDIASPDPKSKYHASFKNNFMAVTPVSAKNSRTSSSFAAATAGASAGAGTTGSGGDEDGFGNFSPMPCTPCTPQALRRQPDPTSHPVVHMLTEEQRRGGAVPVPVPVQEEEVGEWDDGFGNFSPMPRTPQGNEHGYTYGQREPATPGMCKVQDRMCEKVRAASVHSI